MFLAQKSSLYPQVHSHTCHCHPRGENLSQPSAFTVLRQQERVRPKRLSHVYTLQPKGVAWEKCNERVELKFSPSWDRRNIHPNSYRGRSLRSKRNPPEADPPWNRSRRGDAGLVCLVGGSSIKWKRTNLITIASSTFSRFSLFIVLSSFRETTTKDA